MASVAQQDVSPVFFEDTSVAFASKSDSQLRKTYWLFALMNQAWLVNLGTFFIKLALRLRLPIKNLIRSTIFEQFCGGETIADCESVIATLGKSEVGTILDYSVEGEDNEASFEETTAELVHTIHKAARSRHIPFTVFKVTGIGSAELLEKVQRKAELTTPEQEAYERVRERVDRLCSQAHSLGVRIFIDAEESWIQDVIDELAYAMMKKYNTKQALVYNTYQFYRHETLDAYKNAYLKAREKGYFLGGKLVRGAYMEKERIRARENEYRNPIHATKEATDQDFNAAIDFSLDHIDTISFCLGTHNEYSSQYCTQKMRKMGIAENDPRIWFAQLLGMSDNISYNMAKAHYNVAKYVPYGPIDAVMPYLFRRAEENKSISGQTSREFLLVKREMERRGVGTV
ncbi:proline dehydrogenase family protein [Rhabdobacter roseus]|uniref:Proline dehydrogenase n=1 Tax=Rhabdobacter roseus TaxID=1655419 RepID=A0A840TG04_9BACT|nr:proline dehydrogenase family protein [Rhabdobacter roseus]MBB5282414.1 proline dehydrogenase [Rhabdobacter roseus]